MKPTPTPSPAPVLRTSILRRMLAQAVILTAFVIVVLTTLSFLISRTMLERSVRNQISSIAAMAENALEDTLQTHRARTSLLASNTDIRSVLQRTKSAQLLSATLRDIRSEQASLLAISVYDEVGTLMASDGEQILLPANIQGSFARPIVTEAGWVYYEVFTPVRINNVLQGTVAVRYDASRALAPLLAVTPTLGTSAEVILLREQQNRIQVMHPSLEVRDSYMLSVEYTEGESHAFDTLRLVLDGYEGVLRDEDYKGQDSLIAYRYLPTLGWVLSVEVERREALEGVRRLAVSHGAIGTLLLVFAGMLASVLAGQLTGPLRSLVERVKSLQPGHWQIDRFVHTGDEVEMLEGVFADMAERLHQVYEHQEEIIDERTRELKQQYALDRAILENIQYGVITVDSAGMITGSNPAAATLLQGDVHAIVGTSVEQTLVFCGHQGNPLEGVHPVSECLQTHALVRSPVNARYNVRRADESMLPVMYAVSPLQAQGQEFGAIIVFQDISEERRLDYLKSEFISLASHQLRTPLSSLRWYVELIGEQKENLNTDQQSYLKEMEQSVIRMVALLNSLLHAARLEGENMEPDLKEVDLATIVRESEQESAQLCHDANIECKAATPSAPVMFMTDPTLMKIVIQNLLSNAIKYTRQGEKGTVMITLTEAGDDVMINVQDQGMGIPASEQPRVFQKFFRAKNVRKQDTDGNGLGLYITKTIVERLGGTIAFTSEENKGTTFTVTFPKKVPAAPAQSAEGQSQ